MNITKGPWEINERLPGIVENQHGEIIATMGGSVDGSPVDNARLIACAPAMFDLLKKVADSHSDVNKGCRLTMFNLIDIKLIVAKAEGVLA